MNEEVLTLSSNQEFWVKKMLKAKPETSRISATTEVPGESVCIKLSKQEINQLKIIGQNNLINETAIYTAAYCTLLYRYFETMPIVLSGNGYDAVTNCFVSDQKLFFFMDFGSNDSLKIIIRAAKQEITDCIRRQDFDLEALDATLKLKDIKEGYLTYSKFGIGYGTEANISTDEATILQLWINEDDSELSVSLKNNGLPHDSFDAAQFLESFSILITGIKDHIDTPVSQLKLISAAQTKRIAGFSTGESIKYPSEKTLSQLFEENVNLYANAAAVIYNNEEVTYRQLNEYADNVAFYLRDRWSVSENDVIGFVLKKSIASVAIMLGILKAGGAYLAIPMETPEARIDYMLTDCGVKGVIIDDSLDGLNCFNLKSVVNISKIDFHNHQKIAERSLISTAKSLAYIIYTSGSTGAPKGVMIKQESVVNMIFDQIRRFSITSSDRVLLFASLSFDASVSEIFTSLLSGATLIIPNGDEILDKQKVVNLMLKYSVSVATFPPGYLSMFSLDELTSLRCIISAGEAANASQLTDLASVKTVFNAYGPSECTVCVSIHQISALDRGKTRIPIGRPTANTCVYILDPHLAQAPIGVTGRIFVAGIGLTTGYINNKKLTDQKLISNPFRKDDLLYDTGDLGYWRTDGNLEFVGRTDNQVKIRGFRIELEEIEAVLLKFDKTEQASVVTMLDRNGEKAISAHLVLRDGTLDDVKDYLKLQLPPYMIPAHFQRHSRFPVTQSGKIDKEKLATLNEYVADGDITPKSFVEERVLRIWEQVLSLRNLDLNTSFFDLGGNSLLAMQLLTRIRKDLQVEIEIQDVLNELTIKRLSAFIHDKLKSNNLLYEFSLTNGKVSQLNKNQAEVDTFFSYARIEGLEINISNNKLIVNNKKLGEKVVAFIEENKFAIIDRIMNPNQIGSIHPSSYLQNNVWRFLQSKGKFANISFGVVIREKIDVSGIQEAFTKTIARHETLSTKFLLKNGTLFQKLVSFDSRAARINLAKIPITEVKEYCTRAYDICFDLFDNAPLINGHLISVAENYHILFFVVNHLVFDGQSINVFLNDFFLNYKDESLLKALPFQFQDYVAYDEFVRSAKLDKEAENYWRETFADSYDFKPLIFQRKRLDAKKGFIDTTAASKKIKGAPFNAIVKYCKRTNCTLNHFFLAIYLSFVQTYSKTDDVIISSNISNRESGKFENQIGLYTNSMFVRYNNTAFPGKFNQLAETVQSGFLEALNHNRYYSSNRVFNDLGIGEKYGHDVLRKYVFNFFLTTNSNQDDQPLKTSPFALSKSNQRNGCYYLLFLVYEGAKDIKIVLEGNTGYFKKTDLNLMIDHLYSHIIQSVSPN